MTDEKKNEFEGETCESCACWENDEWSCAKQYAALPAGPYNPRCAKGFVPSLECRKVRALELMASTVDGEQVPGGWLAINIRDRTVG